MGPIDSALLWLLDHPIVLALIGIVLGFLAWSVPRPKLRMPVLVVAGLLPLMVLYAGSRMAGCPPADEQTDCIGWAFAMGFGAFVGVPLWFIVVGLGAFVRIKAKPED